MLACPRGAEPLLCSPEHSLKTPGRARPRLGEVWTRMGLIIRFSLYLPARPQFVALTPRPAE